MTGRAPGLLRSPVNPSDDTGQVTPLVVTELNDGGEALVDSRDGEVLAVRAPDGQVDAFDEGEAFLDDPGFSTEARMIVLEARMYPDAEPEPEPDDYNYDDGDGGDDDDDAWAYASASRGVSRRTSSRAIGSPWRPSAMTSVRWRFA